MITKDKKTRYLNKFSQLLPREKYREQRRESNLRKNMAAVHLIRIPCEPNTTCWHKECQIVFTPLSFSEPA